MRKFIRLLALTLALVLLCGLATGCQALDDMRARHATLSDDNKLLYINNTTYRLLPENEYFWPLRQFGHSIYVTEADVPTLLASFVNSDIGNFCNNGVILATSNHNYCRVDQYEKYTALLQRPFHPTGYGYNYSVYDEQAGQYATKQYRLTAEQTAAIEHIITLPSIPRDKTYVDKQTLYNSISLYVCDDTMQLREFQFVLEKYAIYGEETTIHYILASNSTRDVAWNVPAELNDIMAAIMQTSEDKKSSIVLTEDDDISL